MNEELITADAGGGRIKVMRADYTGNSHTAKQSANSEQKKEPVKPVTTNPVTNRKKSFIHKFTDAFFAENDGGNVTDYIIFDVLVPALKNMLSDAINEGVHRILHGDTRRPVSGPGARPGYTSYSSISRPSRPDSRMTHRRRMSNEPSEIITQTRTEAEDVLEELRNLINVYRVATVADLHNLAGITPSFTDENWGWKDLRTASIRITGDGYLIVLPRPQALAS